MANSARPGSDARPTKPRAAVSERKAADAEKKIIAAKLRMRDRMIGDERLTHAERNVGCHLYKYAFGAKTVMDPSQETLASDAKCSTRTVERAVRKLKQFAYVTTRFNGDHNVYRIPVVIEEKPDRGSGNYSPSIRHGRRIARTHRDTINPTSVSGAIRHPRRKNPRTEYIEGSTTQKSNGNTSAVELARPLNADELDGPKAKVAITDQTLRRMSKWDSRIQDGDRGTAELKLAHYLGGYGKLFAFHERSSEACERLITLFGQNEVAALASDEFLEAMKS